jgi:hypothetical protein
MAANFLRGMTGPAPQPTMTTAGGINANPYGGMSAESALAQFTRQQWQTYVSQFMPIENELIEYAMDPAVVQRNMDKAIGGVRSAFEAQPAITERRMRGMGIQLNADEQAATKRDTALQKGLAEVQAANTARDLTVDRQRAIMGGPALPQRDPMGGGR